MRAEHTPHPRHRGASGEGIDRNPRQRRNLRRPCNKVAQYSRNIGAAIRAHADESGGGTCGARDRPRPAARQRKDCARRRHGPPDATPYRRRPRRWFGAARAFLPARRPANRHRQSARGWRRRIMPRSFARPYGIGGADVFDSRMEEATTQSPARRCEARPPATPKLIMAR